MPHLEMDTVAGRISLNEYVTDLEGFQAIAGLTGMGLPPVDTRWVEGTADGSTFRYSRTQSRDLDIPLWLHAEDRVGLKALVSKFSLALSGPITLLWYSTMLEIYELECHHVGGGTINYGSDTTGETDLRTIITLRAGDPFWTRRTSTTVGLSNGDNLLNNIGTAPTPIQWSLTGPLTKFSATSPTGQRIGWTGNLTAGQRLFINNNGRVQTSQSVNLYHQLDPAPKFWRLPPGTSRVPVTFTGTGSAQATWLPRYRMVI